MTTMRPDAEREALLLEYAGQLRRFNTTHNLVSRTATAEQLERHIRHCLYLTHRSFPDGATVVDWGTGGGLPAIPLAITFPDVRFVAIDAVEKKILTVRAMARRLGLVNLEAWHGRADVWSGLTHYSVSRATAPLETLWSWHSRVAAPFHVEDPTCWRPGLVCLKGGDLAAEKAALKQSYPAVKVDIQALEDLGAPTYFEEKALVQVT